MGVVEGTAVVAVATAVVAAVVDVGVAVEGGGKQQHLSSQSYIIAAKPDALILSPVHFVNMLLVP